MNDRNNEQTPQIRLTGTLKPNSVGGEMICFTIRLGLFQLVCIANIPGEGETEAPVYVKFKVNPPQPKGDYAPKQSFASFAEENAPSDL